MKMFTTENGRNLFVTFALVTMLFLLWGFCNGMIDILNKHFQNTLHINKAQSGLVQFANYIGYFLMAIPAGLLAKRFGYKGGIIIGLVLIALGAFWFIPATKIGTYWAFLTGLFILATGMTCLETIANPYATVLGPPESGATRINLAQTFNGVGWILGPIVGGHFIFGAGGEGAAASNAGLYIPYMGVAIVVTVLIVVFAFAYIPDLHATDESLPSGAKEQEAKDKLFSFRGRIGRGRFWVVSFVLAIVGTIAGFAVGLLMGLNLAVGMIAYGLVAIPLMWVGLATSVKRWHDLGRSGWMVLIQLIPIINLIAVIWIGFFKGTTGSSKYGEDPVQGLGKPLIKRHHFTLGVLAQFLYVAAQTGIFSFFINYLVENVHGMTDSTAKNWLGIGGFGLFMTGRACGSFVVGLMKPQKALTLYAVTCFALCLLAMAGLGMVGVVALFGTFFFMSIMFPTIFALGIRGLGEHTKLASSLIVMSIVGGAIAPPFMGWIADHSSMKVGFAVPMICFIFIALYGMFWKKLESKDASGASSDEPITIRPMH